MNKNPFIKLLEIYKKSNKKEKKKKRIVGVAVRKKKDVVSKNVRKSFN